MDVELLGEYRPFSLAEIENIMPLILEVLSQHPEGLTVREIAFKVQKMDETEIHLCLKSLRSVEVIAKDQWETISF